MSKKAPFTRRVPLICLSAH